MQQTTNHTTASAKQWVQHKQVAEFGSDVGVPFIPCDRITLPPKLLQELQFSLLGSWCLIGHIPEPNSMFGVECRYDKIQHAGMVRYNESCAARQHYDKHHHPVDGRTRQADSLTSR